MCQYEASECRQGRREHDHRERRFAQGCEEHLRRLHEIDVEAEDEQRVGAEIATRCETGREGSEARGEADPEECPPRSSRVGSAPNSNVLKLDDAVEVGNGHQQGQQHDRGEEVAGGSSPVAQAARGRPAVMEPAGLSSQRREEEAGTDHVERPRQARSMPSEREDAGGDHHTPGGERGQSRERVCGGVSRR